MNEDLVKEIENISGFNFIDRKGEKVVKLFGKLTDQDFRAFVTVLRNYNKSFSIYDGLYPSMSDPGAYISYSQEKNELDGYWSMTLGNHGWSGGLYHIEESIIINQLNSLRRKNMITEIQIDKGVFLSNFNNVGDDMNEEINKILRQLHEG